MKKTNNKKEQWFFEDTVPYDFEEIKIGVKIKKKLYSGKSCFQKIELYDTHAYGRILALDGVIQTSEKDEFVYHEMLCQTPLFLHSDPKNVLIIGGGDGGSLEEVLKHKVEKAIMVEIDEKVVKLCQKYLPLISKKAFKNKKAELIITDGKEYIKKHKNYFDVIILDLSDPAGPAEDLISLNFYKKVEKALRENGIVSVQSGSFTCQSELVSKIFNRIKKVFPYCEIRRAVVHCYQAGEYSFTIGSKKNLKTITFNQIEKKYKKLNLDLKYYSPEIHFSSKVLPKYLKEKIDK